MKGKGTQDEQENILKVLDRLCNFFLQNNLQETSSNEDGEKVKRSRISSLANDNHVGIEQENAETANLDNCFQVCLDNLDKDDEESEGEIRVF